MRINYWEGGAVRDSGLFFHGKAINEHLSYSLDGNLQLKTSYDSTGNAISTENYDKDNNIKSIFTYHENVIVQYKFYHNTGELSKIVDDSSGVGVDFLRNRLFRNGKLYSDSGGKDGWEYWYWSNGNVREKCKRINYERNGAYYEYKEDGTLWITGFYKGMKQTGLWKWYDKEGNIYTEDSFQ